MATIKKISLNGVSYDLGGGLTEDVKQASLQIAEKVAYIDENGQQYYDDLYTAFYDNMWNVTNTLSNASTSNPATKTAKDGTYTAIISANTGYTLDGATVSITMNGADITATAYNNGTISIPSVTGDVVITVDAVAVELVSISALYTQSGTVYDTDSLDSLKAYLVVTATYSDSSTAIVPSSDYTLSGTLTVGTSTITVTHDEKNTSFNVTVTRLEIKVYKGKGTSGTSIVDNANRALSEMFPLSFANPVHVRFPDRANGTYTTAFKFCNGANAVTAFGASAVPYSYINTSTPAGIYTSWLETDEELWLAYKLSDVWTPVNASMAGTGDGNVRLLFKNVTGDTSPISATIDGIVYINDIPYHLVETDISDFE